MDNELKISVVADFSKFDQQFQRFNKAVKEADGNLEELNKDAQATGRAVNNSFKDLPNRVRKVNDEINKLQKSFKDGRIGAQQFNKQSEVLEKQLNDLRQTAQRAGVESEVFGKKTSTAFTSIRNLAGGLFAGIAVGQAVKQLTDFEQQLSDVATLLGDTADTEIPKFQQGILDIGRDAPVTPEELGASAYAIVSAGITDTSEALDVLEQSSKLAVAGLGDVESSTDLVTSAFNAFKGEGLEADEITNILFETVKNGKTTVDELSQSFGSVAPIAAAAGIKFTELNAATAALTTTGLKASEAQTQIRAATIALIKPSENLKDLFAELGIESGKALIEQEGLVGALDLLAEAVDNDETAIGGLITSTEGLNATLALTGPVAGAFATTLADLEDGVNSIDQAFDKQRETVAAQFQELKNGLFALLIQAGTVILPVLNAAIGTATTVIDGLFSAFSRLNNVVQFFTGSEVENAISSTTTAIEDQKQAVVDLTTELENSTQRRKELEQELTEQIGEEATKRAQAAVEESEERISLLDALLDEAKKTEAANTEAASTEAKARLSVAVTEAQAIREAEKQTRKEIDASRREAVRLAIAQINTLQQQIVALRGERLESSDQRINELEQQIAEGRDFSAFGGFSAEQELSALRAERQGILGELDTARGALNASLAGAAGDLLTLSAEELNQAISEIDSPEALSALTQEWENISEANEGAINTTADYTKIIDDATEEIDKNTKAQGENEKAVGGTSKATKELTDDTKELEKESKKAIKAINDEYKDYEKTLKDVDKLQESINKRTEDFAETGQVGAQQAEQDTLSLDQERVNDLTNELIGINQELKDASGDQEKIENLKEQQKLIQGIISDTRELIGEGAGELFTEAERQAGLTPEEREQEIFEAERARLELRQQVFEAQTEEELEALSEKADLETRALIGQRIEALKTIELERQQKIQLEQELGQQRLSIEEQVREAQIETALQVGAVQQAQAQAVLDILNQIRATENSIQAGPLPLPIIGQAHEGGEIGSSTGSTTLRKPGGGEMLTMMQKGEFVIPNNLNKISASNKAKLMQRIQPLVNKNYRSNSSMVKNDNSIKGVTVNIHEQPIRRIEDLRRVIRKHV